MNRADYRLLVQNEVDDQSTTAAAVINNSIRETYQEVIDEAASYLSGPVAEEVVVTSATVTPTYTFDVITSIHYKSSDTWRELPRLSEQQYTDYLNDTGTEPQGYVLRGNTIILTGSPTSGTIRIQGVPIKNELDDDTETSLIPDRYSRVIVLGATYRFKAYEDNPAAENYFAWYSQAKQKMLQQLSAKAPVLKPSLY